MTRGTRLRHFHGPNLELLEEEIEGLPYKIEIKGVTLKQNGEWYIHFTILDEVVYQAQNDPDNTKNKKAKAIRKKGNKS
jgi:hypothetical protein